MNLTIQEHQEVLKLKTILSEKFGEQEVHLLRSFYDEDFLSLVKKLNIKKINKNTYVISRQQINSLQYTINQ